VILDEFGPACQADLGRRSGIHFSDVVAAFNELADRDLVERATDPADRRRNIITLTAAGRRQLRRLHKQVVPVQRSCSRRSHRTNGGQLTALLARVLDHHSRTRGTATVNSRPDMRTMTISVAGVTLHRTDGG
jgi:DNA-binding MarR family transcriptional regulator